MNILFVAAEGRPFIKTGGLGDVIGSLPRALKEKGADVRVILPLYEGIPIHFKEKMKLIKELTVPLSWRNQYCGLKTLNFASTKFYFLDNEYYFKRNGIYGFYDEAERFAYFCRAVLESLPSLDFSPQIIHCHDWHTGMVSFFRETFYKKQPIYANLRTIFTIHNLAYQGIFPESIRSDILGIDNWFTTAKIQSDYNINFMKAGILFSDLVTTVSPTYAIEIQQPYFGEGLDGLLRENSDKLSGILNGIDYQEFNPLTDPALFVNYRSSLAKKRQNKCKLQEQLGLDISEQTPLLVLISRLVKQKGLDLLAYILPELLQLDLQLVILGTGEKYYEQLFMDYADKNPQKMITQIGFDDKLARRMYAASDVFLMPSLFEPCGLGQLIAMRYGSIPVVRETGGLKDTVRPYLEDHWAEPEQGNGFVFANYNAYEFLAAIKKALDLYQQKEIWPKIVQNALQADYSWEYSAEEYHKLYQSLIGDKR